MRNDCKFFIVLWLYYFFKYKSIIWGKILQKKGGVFCEIVNFFIKNKKWAGIALLTMEKCHIGVVRKISTFAHQNLSICWLDNPILGWVIVVFFWVDNVRLIVGYSIENACLSGQTAKQTLQTRFTKLPFVLGVANYTPSSKRSLCTKGDCSAGRGIFPRATILSTFL